MILSYCEPVWASSFTRIHIRELREGEEPKFNGGIDTPTLCKRMMNYGWDVPGRITAEDLDARLNEDIGPTCPECALEWKRRQPGYIEPPAPTPSLQGQRLIGSWTDEAQRLAEMEDPF